MPKKSLTNSSQIFPTINFPKSRRLGHLFASSKSSASLQNLRHQSAIKLQNRDVLSCLSSSQLILHYRVAAIWLVKVSKDFQFLFFPMCDKKYRYSLTKTLTPYLDQNSNTVRDHSCITSALVGGEGGSKIFQKCDDVIFEWSLRVPHSKLLYLDLLWWIEIAS